jgi:predicted metal-dependent phosphoesterase TrpH
MVRARAAGLEVVALTDHDTVAGWAQAAASLPPGLTLIRGIELSCRYRGRSMHLLGYLFDPDEPELAAELAAIRADRVRRARGMVSVLAALGVPVTWNMVLDLAQGEVIGKPHIAQAMVAAGTIAVEADAYTQDWIGVGGRAHVARYALDPIRAVRLVTAAGGVTVLAHPRDPSRGEPFSDEVIETLAAAGLTGIEADHPGHPPPDRAHLKDLARQLGLLVTGSSDDHGTLTGHRLGCQTTEPGSYDALVARAADLAHQRRAATPGPAPASAGLAHTPISDRR